MDFHLYRVLCIILVISDMDSVRKVFLRLPLSFVLYRFHSTFSFSSASIRLILILTSLQYTRDSQSDG